LRCRGYFVLYSFPLVVLTLFHHLDKPRALLASLVAGYLLLPEQLMYDLPLLPPLNKHTIPVFAVFAVLMFKTGETDKMVLPGWIPKSWLARGFLLALVVGAFFTANTNEDPINIGSRILPGLTIYDAASLILSTSTLLLPFLLARKFLAHPKHHRTVLVTFVIAASFYSFLALYEVRMSPQLNSIVYGFFPHSFLQHIRKGGFRPLVFLNHGLWLSTPFATFGGQHRGAGCDYLSDAARRRAHSARRCYGLGQLGQPGTSLVAWLQDHKRGNPAREGAGTPGLWLGHLGAQPDL